FSIEGTVAKIVVPKGITVTGNLYANNILPEVFTNFKEMMGRNTVQDVVLHHDNAVPHSMKTVTKYLKQERVNILPHPPYSPDLEPCDFFLFPKIKNKKYNKVETLAWVVQAIASSIPKEGYHR